ncbi:MAG: helix-hairpin-helix domain-containing protein [Clostridia bacterium]|nr:helix-hairpin-helix domain-containing protein [Clostridia bacterium]
MKNSIIKVKEYIKNKGFIIGISLLIITIITTNAYSMINTNNKLVINNESISKAKKNTIEIHISGEVKKKGKLVLKRGTTLSKALSKAGGITENANISNLDTERKLINGDKIIIPSKAQIQEKEVHIEEEQIKEAMGELTEEIININKASKVELMKLKGIGEKTAENIIEYRRQKQFEEIEEIMEVKGIGEAKFQSIKNNIKI